MSYATPADLADSGLPAAALVNVTNSQQQRFLDLASAKMDSYFRAQSKLTLNVPYPLEVVRCCVDLACYDLLVWRGYQPDHVDSNWRLRVEDQIRWLEGIAAGRVALALGSDSSTVRIGRPQVWQGGGSSKLNMPADGETRGW